MRLRRLYALVVARNKEFTRDRHALGWNLLFPLVVVIGLAFAFSEESERMPWKVAVHGEAATPAQEALLGLRHVDYLPVDELERAVRSVERHRVDLLLAFDGVQTRYWSNDDNPAAYLLERALLAALAEAAPGQVPELQRAQVSGAQVSYVQWVLPGVLAVNIMFSALYGIGFVTVRYRKNGVLKRLRATPLRASDFLLAQLLSRIWLIVLVSVPLFAGMAWFLGLAVEGSPWLLLLVLLVGTFSLIAMGMIVAARLVSEELADGLLNLISWPMMLLSGVWFSLEGAHPAMQALAALLPLTHMLEAARGIIFDGHGLLEIAPHLAALVLMTALFLAVGARLFRWE